MNNALTTHVPVKCADCGAATYPAQGFCSTCLSENVQAVSFPFKGTVKAISTLRYSLEEAIKPHLPLTLAAVHVSSGTVVFAFVEASTFEAGTGVVLVEKDIGFGPRLVAVRDK